MDVDTEPLMLLLRRHAPVAIAAGHIILVIYLTFAVSRSLYRSYLELPPSQETRLRKSHRQRHMPIFAALAAASFAYAAYTTFTYAILSYKVWAVENDIPLPVRFWGNDGILPFRDNHTLKYVSRWLIDTPVYLDAFEILAEKARRHWWGQQLDLAVLPWSLLLSIEGRRRNIPFTWAYLGLAHLVGLSFAQNLFYIALLLTPAPIPSRPDDTIPASGYISIRDSIFPPKPVNWCPHPLLFLIGYSLSGAGIFLAPAIAGTGLSTRLLLITRGLDFLPILMPYIVPESWGTLHSHPHRAYNSFSALFRLLSTMSLVLHGRTTFWALARVVDDSQHRHSAMMNVDLEKLALWERTTYGLGRIFGALYHHPVISRASGDVILSALSLGLWSAIRAITAEDILSSAVPFYPKIEAHAVAHDATAGEEMLAEASIKVEPPTPSPSAEPKRRRGRPAKVKAEQPTTDEDAPAPTTPRKRGRRPRKRKSVSTTPAPEDAYVPAAEERAVIPEGDEVRLVDGELAWESAALAWGVTVVGGLGCGSSGVFGGECVSR
ncbi:Uncharacterized protein SAPIO_CDS5639 [Scedosporium apiospermum]|uniref:Uncharacterized protein n=1 Tax=Pseudallescheria apiosperma TaxID=563466 RepID=A0A084G529_PSEDA|nr:Uncharacterized protein SAPIO_CDS5639 [Scedosporium apiospermum]KEZ42441.1 Uncharacterized protein SAPIO_CDS5639 [Scedosporium apiospermum]